MRMDPEKQQRIDKEITFSEYEKSFIRDIYDPISQLKYAVVEEHFRKTFYPEKLLNKPSSLAKLTSRGGYWSKHKALEIYGSAIDGTGLAWAFNNGKIDIQLDILHNIGQLSTKQNYLLEWLWEKPGHLQLICPQSKVVYLTSHRNGREYINSTCYREKENEAPIHKIAKDLKLDLTEDNMMVPDASLLKTLSDMIVSVEATTDELKIIRMKLSHTATGQGPPRAGHGKLRAWQAPLRARDKDTTIANLQAVREHCHDITITLQQMNTYVESHPNVVHLVPKLKFLHEMVDKMSTTQSQVDDISISLDENEKLDNAVKVYVKAVDHILAMLQHKKTTDDITIPDILAARVSNNPTEKKNTVTNVTTARRFSTYPNDTKSEPELFPWDVVQVIIQPQLTYAMVVEGWPQIAGDWLTRLRQWPPSKIIIDVTEAGFHLVPRCSFYGMMTGGDLEWSICFARAETTLLQCFNETMKHTYFIFKCLFATTMDSPQPHDNWVHTPGNNTLMTYHMKTIMLWAAEKHSMDYWQDWNLGRCILDLITDLLDALKTKTLPHYFIPENNLFEHFGDEYITFVKEKFQLLRALPLTLPKDKKYCAEFAIYVDGYCDKLLDTFIHKH